MFNPERFDNLMNYRYLFNFLSLRWVGIVLFFLTLTTVSGQTIQQWYNNAQARIDTLRRGSFQVVVTDENNQPYTGEVSVKLKKHEFPFGIAFDFYEGEVTTEVPTPTQWEKAAMYKYYNYGVSGNSFKWSGIDHNGNGANYTNFEYALDWTQKVGWDLRAHTLLWGGSEGDNHAMPQWVTRLGSAKAVFDKCEERVRREVSRYKGLIHEYDVINEPLHATYTQDLYGDSLNWKCFNWAREEDPDAELYINEYNVEYGWGDADEYKALIEDIIRRGAPVTGIGMQAHFWECCRPDVTDFVTQINKLAEIGLPIKFTEFDYAGDISEAEQASDLIKVYTIAFSHPAVNGIIYWNLADHLSWRDNAGILRTDRSPKLAADTLLYLTKELWNTNFKRPVTSTGAVSFDAYYGDYIVEVTFGDEVKQFPLELYRESNGTTFQLNASDAEAKQPELLGAFRSTLEVKLIYDQPIDESTISKYDFRLFSPNNVTIESIIIDPNDDHNLLLQLTNEIDLEDYVTVSYFPGSLSSKNGAPAEAFGVEEVGIDFGDNAAPVFENQEFTMASNAQYGTEVGVMEVMDPEGSTVSFKILSGNHLGIFKIERNSGLITLINPFYLDFDKNDSYKLTIEVNDGFNRVSAYATIYPGNVLKIKKQLVSVYPNPSDGLFTVNSKVGFNNILIHDLSGFQIFNRTYSEVIYQDEIQANLPNGVYFLSSYHGTVRADRTKIIVNNK